MTVGILTIDSTSSINTDGGAFSLHGRGPGAGTYASYFASGGGHGGIIFFKKI